LLHWAGAMKNKLCKLGFAVGIVTLVGTVGCANGELGLRSEALDDDDGVTVSMTEMLGTWTRDGDWLVSPAFEAPAGASRVGALVGLTNPGELPEMEARVLMGDGATGSWTPLSETWGEVDQHVATAELGDIGDGAQLRIRATAVEALRVLQWTAVIPEPASADDAAPISEVGGASTALRAELTGLGIVSRASWGARATRCTASDSGKTRMAVHHTVSASSDPARQLRGIQSYHMDTRGWCDVGYHFLIGQDGKVYEGRPVQLLGAHVASNNTGNVGISFIGCFHTSGCAGLGSTTPTDASVQIAGRLMGTLSRLYGITLDSAHVKGHYLYPGASTTCPGDNLRGRVAEMISTGRSSTLSSAAPPPAPPPPPRPAAPPAGASCTHSYGGRYANTACSASYQCCGGSWRTRGGCGACFCVESSGTTGCGT
jgi:hypothetical protein